MLNGEDRVRSVTEIFDTPCSPGGSFIDQNTRTQPISSQAHSGPAILTFGFLARLLFLAPANACAESFAATASRTVAATGELALTIWDYSLSGLMTIHILATNLGRVWFDSEMERSGFVSNSKNRMTSFYIWKAEQSYSIFS
jgi:hypothetical protein